MNTKGKALISGGHGELALAMVSEFSEAGLDVLSPGRDELDVSEEKSVLDYFAELRNLDLMVCNAGVTDDGMLLKMSEQSWDAAMAVNLKGAYLCAKAAAKIMMKKKLGDRGGHIVFISSYSAFHPPAGQANYAAAKAALSGLAKSLAQELGSRNIRVNIIIPGFIETKMTRCLAGEVREKAGQAHSLKRFNTVSSIAKFLRCLHVEMVHTSGQIFNLDSRIL